MAFYRSHVLVCGGTPCLLGGCRGVKDALVAEIERQGLTDEIKVVETGCLGPCDRGPVLVVYPEGITYVRVKVEDVPAIVAEHLLKGRVVERLVYRDEAGERLVSYAQSTYYGPQKRVVLRNCGVIDPESIEEYIARDGYAALAKALTAMTPAAVVEEIKASGLRGRGGAAFPTGLKWSFTAKAQADQKYIVCNADEGEPGTFKDRLILEGDPHSVLEGMIIAGYAVGATRGFIYIRGEYRQSIARMAKAIARAREMGLLGRNILGTGFSFEVEIREGAGAYICGDETALIESIEGNRGEPRVKPPFPGVHGLWGRPTVVNNVETLANVAPIIDHGAAWFRSMGTENSPGTKVFTMTGDINNEGLIEVEMGIPLRQIIYEIGGGIPGGRGFKMAQTGGTSGGCLPTSFLDLPMDYDTLAQHGAALGSGALLVMDDTHCIVDIIKCFQKFFAHESCGRCTPCREGTVRLYEMIGEISEGRGTREHLRVLEELGRVMTVAPLCGLGQTAAVPLLSCLKHFREEIETHVLEGRCPTGVCKMGKAPVVA
ncbi:MAG: NADH-quinone oxidoreductase subunit NuoF [Firmicutes bacterium]|nr:NADH-quinone oxidoreductase subunit NuoF [Bacillota bacterium]